MTEATSLEQEESQNTRIRNLEKRVDMLEQRLLVTDGALEKIIQLVRTSESNRTRNIMRVLSDVFHGVSDQLGAISNVPTAEQYGVQRVEPGTPGTVVVTRKGNEYTFANAEEPETLINQGTDILVEVFNKQQVLADGDTGWFSLFLDDKKSETNGIPATESSPDQVGA
jgi:hypothetical protein